MFWRRFNKTIIPLALVGYEMVLAIHIQQAGEDQSLSLT